jgi:stage III sporulation protein AH
VVLEIKKAKRVALIAGLLLIVIVAVNVFWGNQSFKEPINVSDNPNGEIVISGEKTLEKDFPGETNFFAEYRVQRERIRSQEMQILEELAHSEEQGQVTRDAASLKIMRIMEEREREMKAENLVKSRGIKECVIISEPDTSTVVIEGSARVINEDEIRSLLCDVLKVNEENLSMVFRNGKIE